jgi:hypothetical protein
MDPMPGEELQRPSPDPGRGAVRQESEQQIAGRALHETEHHPLSARPDHRIDLPIAVAGASSDHRRSIRHRELAREASAPLDGAVALARPLPPPQQAIELPTEPPVATHKATDRPRGDVEPALGSERLSDLLRAPPFLEQGDHQRPVRERVPPLPVAGFVLLAEIGRLPGRQVAASLLARGALTMSIRVGKPTREAARDPATPATACAACR